MAEGVWYRRWGEGHVMWRQRLEWSGYKPRNGNSHQKLETFFPRASSESVAQSEPRFLVCRTVREYFFLSYQNDSNLYDSHRKQIPHPSSTLPWSPKDPASCSSAYSWSVAWWLTASRCSVYTCTWVGSDSELVPPLLDGSAWGLWPCVPSLPLTEDPQPSSPMQARQSHILYFHV